MIDLRMMQTFTAYSASRTGLFNPNEIRITSKYNHTFRIISLLTALALGLPET